MKINLTARPAGEHVYANIVHEGGAHSLLIPLQDAEAWALKLMAAVDEARGKPLLREEPTRPQCRKCLKDCAACTCAEDCISKGRA